MADRNSDTDAAERATRNDALQKEDDKLHDPDQRTPRHAVDHDAVRPAPATTADTDIAQLENPPQSEGPRERNNDAV